MGAVVDTGGGGEVADSPSSHGTDLGVRVGCCLDEQRQAFICRSAVAAQAPDRGDDNCTPSGCISARERVCEVGQCFRSKETKRVSRPGRCFGIIGLFCQFHKGRQGRQSICSKQRKGFQSFVRGGRMDPVEELLEVVLKSETSHGSSPSRGFVTNPCKQYGYCVCSNGVDCDYGVHGLCGGEPVRQRVSLVGWFPWSGQSEGEYGEQKNYCRENEQGSAFPHGISVSRRGAVERAN